MEMKNNWIAGWFNSPLPAVHPYFITATACRRCIRAVVNNTPKPCIGTPPDRKQNFYFSITTPFLPVGKIFFSFSIVLKTGWFIFSLSAGKYFSLPDVHQIEKETGNQRFSAGRETALVEESEKKEKDAGNSTVWIVSGFLSGIKNRLLSICVLKKAVWNKGKKNGCNCPRLLTDLKLFQSANSQTICIVKSSVLEKHS